MVVFSKRKGTSSPNKSKKIKLAAGESVDQKAEEYDQDYGFCQYGRKCLMPEGMFLDTLELFLI